jgi:hypothetical protein
MFGHMQVNRLTNDIKKAVDQRAIATLRTQRDTAKNELKRTAHRGAQEVKSDPDPQLNAALQDCSLLQRHLPSLAMHHFKEVSFSEASDVYEHMHWTRAAYIEAEEMCQGNRLALDGASKVLQALERRNVDKSDTEFQAAQLCQTHAESALEAGV